MQGLTYLCECGDASDDAEDTEKAKQPEDHHFMQLQERAHNHTKIDNVPHIERELQCTSRHV